MKALTNSEYADAVLKMAAAAKEFEAQVFYDRDGDCVEFVAAPDSYYAERIDDLVTVYYSRDTGEIIGSLLKGVTAFCKRTLLVQRDPPRPVQGRGGVVRAARTPDQS